MATRALLYRRPAEPSRLLVKHGSQIYSIRLRRHRRARRYTLRIHPSDREAILTMPPRGTLADAKEFAQRHGAWIAARLGRLPKAAPFFPGTVVPLRGVAASDRASRRRARNGLDRDARQRRADSLRRRRPRAYRAPRPRLPQARSAPRSAEGGAVLRRSARRPGKTAVDPRSVEPLGFLHLGGFAVVLVAADSRAALCAGLSRRPRGRASGRDEPLAAVLAGGRRGSATTSSAPRHGSTPQATICIATACRIERRHLLSSPGLTGRPCTRWRRDQS